MIKRQYRYGFEDHFTQVPNQWVRDARLSRRARGLLVELLSHRPGWEVSLESLVEAGPEGRDAIRSAISELEQFGYLQRQRQRAEGGRLAGVDYLLVDPWETSSGKSNDGETHVGEPTGKKTISQEDQHLFEVGEEHGRGKRATTVPNDFALTAEMVAWAAHHMPELEVGIETQAFLNHHAARGTKFKLWGAAWKKWMINAQRYAHERQQQQAPQKQSGVHNMAAQVDPYADTEELSWRR